MSEDFFVQNGWINDGRVPDGYHHQVKWEWMNLSQMELVWVRVRVEEECFWVNLREDNKVSESKMTVSESNMADFKMVAIIKLSQNEWVKIFLCKRWLNPRWQYSRWLPSSSSVRMNDFESDWHFFDSESEWSESVYEWIWEKITRYLKFKMAVSESNMAEFKMAAIIIRLN